MIKMKWKKFTDEMPETELAIFIRDTSPLFKSWIEKTSIKRPYDVNPTKYRDDFYQFVKHDNFGLKWVDIDKDFMEKYEWLDPFEDRN